MNKHVLTLVISVVLLASAVVAHPAASVRAADTGTSVSFSVDWNFPSVLYGGYGYSLSAAYSGLPVDHVYGVGYVNGESNSVVNTGNFGYGSSNNPPYDATRLWVTNVGSSEELFSSSLLTPTFPGPSVSISFDGSVVTGFVTNNTAAKFWYQMTGQADWLPLEAGVTASFTTGPGGKLYLSASADGSQLVMSTSWDLSSFSPPVTTSPQINLAVYKNGGILILGEGFGDGSNSSVILTQGTLTYSVSSSQTFWGAKGKGFIIPTGPHFICNGVTVTVSVGSPALQSNPKGLICK